jgi:hypothetical protein
LDALPELAAAVDQEAGLSRLRLFRKVRDALSESAMVFCLVDAPDAEAAAAVHREAHGLVADEIYPVAEGA